MKILSVILISLLTACSPADGALERPSQATSPSVSAVQPRQVPPTETKIYLRGSISPKWNLKSIAHIWSKAKYVDFVVTDKCPDDIIIPCVTLVESYLTDRSTAGETEFGSYPGDIIITLSPDMSNKESAITVCHELGHVLGLWHLKDKRSCMSDSSTWSSSIPLPSDIRLVDSLGPWSLEKVTKSIDRADH